MNCPLIRRSNEATSAIWKLLLQVLENLSKKTMVPSGYVKIAFENGHRNSEFSHEKWWFSIAMLVYQRVFVGPLRYYLWILKESQGNQQFAGAHFESHRNHMIGDIPCNIQMTYPDV